MAPITSAISPIRLRNVVDAIQAARDDGVRLAVVGDRRLRKCPLQDGARLRHVRAALRRQREQVALGRAAARGDQSRAVQPLAGDHHARPHVEAARHAVRFRHHDAGDAKILAADVQQVAGAHVEPHQQIVGDHHRLRVQRLAQGPRRIQLHHAVVGVRGRVHRLHRNQQRVGRGRGRRHRHRLRDPRAAHAARFQTAQRRLLLRGRQREHPRRQIARHQRARLAQQHVAE